MSNVTIHNVVDRLDAELTEGYSSLSKWIIALSTGAIAFGVTLIKPETGMLWKQELFFGLGLLGISILTGVRYVRLRLDYSTYNLEIILNTKQLEYMQRSLAVNKHAIDGPELKDFTPNDLLKKIAQTKSKMEIINREQRSLFRCQQWLFYIGIISIVFFGALNIY